MLGLLHNLQDAVFKVQLVSLQLILSENGLFSIGEAFTQQQVELGDD